MRSNFGIGQYGIQFWLPKSIKSICHNYKRNGTRNPFKRTEAREKNVTFWMNNRKTCIWVCVWKRKRIFKKRQQEYLHDS